MTQSHRFGFRKLNIDLALVPASRHSIFVRGLPRSVDAEDVRETIAAECGHCSTLFQRLRPNGIFLVFRFEKTEEAKRAIERFDGWKYKGEHRLTVNWYKDVLKYHLEQTQKQRAVERNCPPYQLPDHEGFHQQANPFHAPCRNTYRSFGGRAVNRAKRWWHFKSGNNRQNNLPHRPLNMQRRMFNKSDKRNNSFQRAHELMEQSFGNNSDEEQHHRSHDRYRENSQDRPRENSNDRSNQRSSGMSRNKDRSCDRSEVRSRGGSRDGDRGRMYERSSSYDKGRPSKRIWERSCDRYRGNSSERSSGRSWERDHGQTDLKKDKHVDQTDNSSRDGSYDQFSAQSRDGSSERSNERSSAESIVDKNEDLRYGRWTSKEGEQRQRSRSRSQESGSIKQSSEPRSPDASPRAETDDRKLKQPLQQSLQSKHNNQENYLETLDRCGKNKHNVLQKVRDLEPGELESSSQEGSPATFRDEESSEDNTGGSAAEEKLSSGKSSVMELLARIGDKTSAKRLLEASSSNTRKGCWIEVRNIAKKGQKTQSRKFMMEKKSNDEEPDEVKSGASSECADLHGGRNGMEDSSDMKMRNLEEAITVSLHQKNKAKFTREIFREGNTQDSPSKCSKSEPKEKHNTLEAIRAEEMAKLEADCGEHGYELESPLLSTSKTEFSFQNTEDTPTKDEKPKGDTSETSGSGSRPFFLRFTPHRLSYQSPLAIFSSLEDPQAAGDGSGGGKKKIYRPDKETDFAASLVSKLTGTKSYSERKNTSIPNDDRLELDFIDSELEKSYEEKKSDKKDEKNSIKKEKPKPKMTSLVPYAYGDGSLNHSDSSHNQSSLLEDDSICQDEEEADVPRGRRKSRSNSRRKHSRSRTTPEMSRLSDSSMLSPTETSDTSFSSPTKPVRTKKRHPSKRKRSPSPNSSTSQTTSFTSDGTTSSDDRSKTKARTRSPECGSSSPITSESPRGRANKLSREKSNSVSPSRSAVKRSWSQDRFTEESGESVKKGSKSRSCSPGPCLKRKRLYTRSRSPSPETPVYGSQTPEKDDRGTPSPIKKIINETAHSPTKTTSNKPKINADQRTESPTKNTSDHRKTSPSKRRQRSLESPRSRSPSPNGSGRSRHRDDDLSSMNPLSLHTKEILTSTPAKSRSPMKKKGLSRGQMQRVLQKKEELESAFKKDCETICTVTKMLLSKDQSMEEQLCESAGQLLTDLGGKFVDQLQEFIDSLSTKEPRPPVVRQQER